MNRRSFLAGSASILAFGGTPRSTRPNQADKEKRKEITSVIQQASVPLTTIHRIQADGITVFYRAAGPAKAPVVLLLRLPDVLISIPRTNPPPRGQVQSNRA